MESVDRRCRALASKPGRIAPRTAPCRGIPRPGSVRSTTDDKGRFRLEGLGPGTYVVGAQARGYGRAHREGARPGRAVDLFLFAGASIGGTVLGPDSKPIPGAVVQARAAQHRSGSPPQVSDADGRFDLVGLDPGRTPSSPEYRGSPPDRRRDRRRIRGRDARRRDRAKRRTRRRASRQRFRPSRGRPCAPSGSRRGRPTRGRPGGRPGRTALRMAASRSTTFHPAR